MKYRVTINVGNVEFSAKYDNIADAYEAVKAIIKLYHVEFPNEKESCSYYMGVLARMAIEAPQRCNTAYFAIESERAD